MEVRGDTDQLTVPAPLYSWAGTNAGVCAHVVVERIDCFSTTEKKILLVLNMGWHQLMLVLGPHDQNHSDAMTTCDEMSTGTRFDKLDQFGENVILRTGIVHAQVHDGRGGT